MHFQSIAAVFKLLWRRVGGAKISTKSLAFSNSIWAEWRTIQGVIAQVISKSDEGEAQGRFEITSRITP